MNLQFRHVPACHVTQGFFAHPVSVLENGADGTGDEEDRGLDVSAMSVPVFIASIRTPPACLGPLAVDVLADVFLTRTQLRFRNDSRQSDTQWFVHFVPPNNTCCEGTKDDPRPLREQRAARSIPWETLPPMV